MARRRSRATVVARSGTTATTMVPTTRNRGTARCRNVTELPIRLPSSEHTRRGCQEPKEPSRQPERDDECAARVLRPTFLRENSRAAGSQGGSTTLRGHLRYRYLLITPVLCACRSHGLELWLFDRARRGETAKDAPGPCHQVRGRPQKVVTLERRNRSGAEQRTPFSFAGVDPDTGPPRPKESRSFHRPSAEGGTEDHDGRLRNPSRMTNIRGSGPRTGLFS